MKKIIFTLLFSLISFQTWACSCFFDDFSFTGIWSTAIEEGWGLPHLAECVAVEETCEGMLYVVNKVVHEGDSTSDIAVGDTIRLWNGDGGLCYAYPIIPIGETRMIALNDFWTGEAEYIWDIYGCTDGDIEEYSNYYIDLCGPGTLPVVDGNVGDMTYNEFEAFIAESLTWNITNVNLKVILEGAYNGTGNNMNATLWEQSYFPLEQPFNIAPYNYEQTVSALQWNLYNIVDWVLVEARTGTPQVSGEKGTETVETVAGLITATGNIVDANGSSLLKFRNLDPAQTYHFCVRHRNHLDILTATALAVNEDVIYDFTTSTDQAFGNGQQKWNDDGTKAIMYVGDFNQDGIIQLSDFDAWKANPAQLDVYSVLDGTLDGTVQVTDFDVWLPNKAKIGVVEIGF